jgi:N-methylhydantoinase A/oxoprolinase/acetone carboxylase beta subunit
MIGANSQSNESNQKSENKSKSVDFTKAFFERNGQLEPTQTPIWKIEDLEPNMEIKGPVIILNGTGTVVVEPDFSAFLDSNLNIFLKYKLEKTSKPPNYFFNQRYSAKSKNRVP